MISHSAARKRLRAAVDLLEQGKLELLAVHKTLAPRTRKRSPLEDHDDEPSASTEIRSVIECIIRDSLEPAIRDLLGAAAYRPRSRKKGRGDRGKVPEPGGRTSRALRALDDPGLVQVLCGVEALRKKKRLRGKKSRP